MSALCGIINFDGAPVDPEVLQRMTAAALHRGPDGIRHWIEGNVALAHLAFHVTPESTREQQPLLSPDGRLVLVADARIDNREELLGALGGDLPPDPTDADLILAAWWRWGELSLERLLGDFVFAMWDRREQRLFLARDALGARSLCYSFDGRRCLFASEVGQILDSPNFPLQINEGKIAVYLANIQQGHEETFFEGVSYCPPAHILTLSRGGVRKHRYWEVDPTARIRYPDDRDYAAHFLELVTAAVRCRLRAIGPVGISLSGGQDSTLLAAVASRLLPELKLPQTRLKSFSYVFDELTSCDERAYIRPVVERYGLDATYIPTDDQWTLKDLANWPVERDYLCSDAFALLAMAVARAARQAGCRVLLDGHFGDVLFLGGRYWAADWLQRRGFGELLRALVAHRRDIDWREDLIDHGIRQLVPVPFKRAYRRWRPRRVSWEKIGLHPDLVARTRLTARAAGDALDRCYTAPGQWVRLSTLTDSSWAEGAGEARKLYNRLGLEAESPYYDRRLVEFVMALPADQLGRPWRNRWVQRNAMRGLLPEAVCERRAKTTFDPLMKLGLFERENETVQGLLQDSRGVRDRFVEAGWLARALSVRLPPVDVMYQLWLFLSLELWLQCLENRGVHRQ